MGRGNLQLGKILRRRSFLSLVFLNFLLPLGAESAQSKILDNQKNFEAFLKKAPWHDKAARQESAAFTTVLRESSDDRLLLVDYVVSLLKRQGRESFKTREAACSVLSKVLKFHNLREEDKAKIRKRFVSEGGEKHLQRFVKDHGKAHSPEGGLGVQLMTQLELNAEIFELTKSWNDLNDLAKFELLRSLGLVGTVEALDFLIYRLGDEVARLNRKQFSHQSDEAFQSGNESESQEAQILAGAFNGLKKWNESKGNVELPAETVQKLIEVLSSILSRTQTDDVFDFVGGGKTIRQYSAEWVIRFGQKLYEMTERPRSDWLLLVGQCLSGDQPDQSSVRETAAMPGWLFTALNLLQSGPDATRTALAWAFSELKSHDLIEWSLNDFGRVIIQEQNILIVDPLVASLRHGHRFLECELEKRRPVMAPTIHSIVLKLIQSTPAELKMNGLALLASYGPWGYSSDTEALLKSLTASRVNVAEWFARIVVLPTDEQNAQNFFEMSLAQQNSPDEVLKIERAKKLVDQRMILFTSTTSDEWIEALKDLSAAKLKWKGPPDWMAEIPQEAALEIGLESRTWLMPDLIDLLHGANPVVVSKDWLHNYQQLNELISKIENESEFGVSFVKP